MRLGKEYFDPKSSFMTVEKDFKLIARKMLKDQDLMKLLYYTQPDCLKADDLQPEQIIGMLNKQIRIVPKIDIEKDCPIQVIITFDNFVPNPNNPEFRDHTISFDVLCHPDHWNLGDFQLRPYKIIGHIDALFNNQKLTGIGELQFLGCNDLVLNEQLMGLTAIYQSTHSKEDITLQ